MRHDHLEPALDRAADQPVPEPRFSGHHLPSNTDYDGRAPASRNEWVAAQNVALKPVAEEEGAVLVDLNGAFMKSGRPLSALLSDHVHPSAIGYDIMAQTWFDAITKAYSKILTNP